MKKRVLILLVVSPLVLQLTGYVIPALFSKNGTELYQGEEKRYAQAAIEDVKRALSSPSLYKLYTTSLRVTSLSSTGNERCPFEVVVQGYTFFHIANKAQKWLVQPGCNYRPDVER